MEIKDFQGNEVASPANAEPTPGVPEFIFKDMKAQRDALYAALQEMVYVARYYRLLYHACASGPCPCPVCAAITASEAALLLAGGKS